MLFYFSYWRRQSTEAVRSLVCRKTWGLRLEAWGLRREVLFIFDMVLVVPFASHSASSWYQCSPRGLFIFGRPHFKQAPTALQWLLFEVKLLGHKKKYLNGRVILVTCISKLSENFRSIYKPSVLQYHYNGGNPCCAPCGVEWNEEPLVAVCKFLLRRIQYKILDFETPAWINDILIPHRLW